jgi:hypothetical protein
MASEEALEDHHDDLGRRLVDGKGMQQRCHIRQHHRPQICDLRLGTTGKLLATS